LQISVNFHNNEQPTDSKHPYFEVQNTQFLNSLEPFKTAINHVA